MIDIDLYKSILVLITGCLTGSFLNVVIYRMPREKSLVMPGSKCPGCDRPIAFYDNIPVISWLILGAKCRKCKEKISIRYPIVELITGILFFLTYQNFDISLNWMFLSYFMCLMVVITYIDIDFMLMRKPRQNELLPEVIAQIATDF
ncbi:MAG: prepilin peptidase [Proteobacteria bacterium]|nr:MAG: prepilin peptidase [Pseudomonadota bacterium]